MKPSILMSASVIMVLCAIAFYFLGCAVESEPKKNEPFVMPQDQHGVHCWGECWVHHPYADADSDAMTDAGVDG